MSRIKINPAQIYQGVKRFWILDFGFWIDLDHKGQTILDLGFWIKSKI